MSTTKEPQSLPNYTKRSKMSRNLRPGGVMDKSEVAQPIAKIISVWAAVGITSWADFAAMLAALYSLLLISEWFYKMGISRGWWSAPKFMEKKKDAKAE